MIVERDAMDFTKKFRELIVDPFEIPFSNWKLYEVWEYYHAGNDVLHCRDADNKQYILKLARQPDADFKNHVFSAEILHKAGWTTVQQCIEHGYYNDVEFLVIPYVEGMRISQELQTYRNNEKEYCLRFGKNIAAIHALNVHAPTVQPRKFHALHTMETDPPELQRVAEWLVRNVPGAVHSCFIHGDHHNANILWKDTDITCILDWELSGIGNKEFDLAWAVVPRMGQQIFFTTREEEYILNGYLHSGIFEYSYFNYYKVLILSHFYRFSHHNCSYQKWIQHELQHLT